MKLTVDFILSFFRFMVWLLERATAARQADVESATATITSLIHKREAAQSEIFRAQAAAKKLKEFGI